MHRAWMTDVVRLGAMPAAQWHIPENRDEFKQ